ncbi:hypothetical protein BC830DRAFT_871734 [Chytriomyces sp. MP71]|nr:hypothetical protein BC830DRAFT_871734 [Chytriomyces sp. MP71]
MKHLFQVVPNRFIRLTAQSFDTRSSKSTPIATPNWTPNTAGYQEPLYPPSKPFFSPRGTPKYTTPEPNSDYHYGDPILKPIETLKDYCHLNSQDYAVEDYESFPICNGALMTSSPGFLYFEQIVRKNYNRTGISFQSVMFIIRHIEKFCVKNMSP